MPDKRILVFGPQYREVEVGRIATIAREDPLRLDCGAALQNVPIAFQTYGELNADRSNAILVCHGLTSDQYLCGAHPVTGKPGWWEALVGPGKLLDTNRYYIICSNVLGGCLGSLGPKDINPETGRPYGLSFPLITVGDMVRAQAMLLEELGIEKLFCVIGGSLGGMQALQWMADYPEKFGHAVVIAATARHSAQNIAFHEIGRQAVMADPDWAGGEYLEAGSYPVKGLAVARMTAHVTYMSEMALHRKFGRDLQDRASVSYGFDADFQVESYLRHQGVTFVERFDANSYLYITRAMDYFDLAAQAGGSLSAAFQGLGRHRICVISFSTDWLFPTEESRQIVRALNAAAANVSFVEVATARGHDAFLLDEPAFHDVMGGFLEGCAEE